MGVFKTLITESQYKKLFIRCQSIKLHRIKVKFTPFVSYVALPVFGKVMLVLKNLNGLKVKSMAYVIQGGEESLLGRRGIKVLGIIAVNPKGSAPGKKKGHPRKTNGGFPGSLPRS